MNMLTLRAGFPFVLILALAACGPNAGELSDTGTTPEGTGVAASSAPTEETPSTLWRGGEQVPLDIQVPHPNGTVLQLTSLQSRQTETVLGIRVINGDDREIQLNRFNNNRNGYIVVDSGERIYLSPPTENRTLAIQPGQTMEGELVFLGRLPQAQSGILILNENNSAENEYTNTPGFRINLPLSAAPGTPTAGAVQ
jgi:hypothetical protein